MGAKATRSAWAYPRGRGGTLTTKWFGDPKQGLSPRARGNLKGIIMPLPRSGPIPAGAGEPNPDNKKCELQWAYPRGRGGTDDGGQAMTYDWGLSPRARGNPG